MILQAVKAKLPQETNRISGKIIDSAFEVHSTLGPGLLESIYEACLVYELSKRGLSFSRQKTLPIQHKDVSLDAALRIDLLVENKIIVELKAVETLLPVHEAQMLTYLKLTKCRLGLLLNFNVSVFKTGIKRIIL